MGKAFGIIVFSLCGCLCALGPAATWYVDDSVPASGDGTSWESPFTTIQQGIDSASDGDTVLVAEGTYVENTRFNGKNIVLTSTDPLDPTVVAGTIIDGSQSGPVVFFRGTEDESCTLSGFTVRNGSTTGSGGGINGGTWDEATRATIKNNVVVANSSGSYSGGGGLAHCDGRIEGNAITGNSAYEGGGLYSCRGLIQNNDISANSAHRGGGLRTCDGPIQNNAIHNNTADTDGGGLYSCDGTVQNNAIYGNSAGEGGGGLSVCSGPVQNNTIYGNSAGRGGGLYACHGTIRNCIVWANVAAGSGNQMDECVVPSFSCIKDWPGGGEGNIGEEPQFRDLVSSDFRLEADSPCMGAGINFYWCTWPQRDLDGNCRLSGDRMDMGCYEHGASPDSDGDLLSDSGESAAGTDPYGEDSDGDGLRDGLEILRGSDPLTATSPQVVHVPSGVLTIQQALCQAIKGEEIVVAPGIYQGNLRFCGTDVVLRSSNPEDPDIVGSTVLDGRRMGPVVWFVGIESEASVLAGFTIQNGDALAGGGVSGWQRRHHAYPRIQNNVITGNHAVSGGGVAYCHGLISGNRVYSNWSDVLGAGLAGCDGSIRNNVVYLNRSDSSGGGLANCDGVVENNTIVANRALYGAGALHGCTGSIRNCVIWGNKPIHDGQVRLSSSPMYSCIEWWTGAGEGNIALNPHFVDAIGGDFHLNSWSPCVDAGDPASPFINEPEPNGGRVNMGAYGNTREATSKSPDADGDSLPDDWEGHWLGGLAGDGTGDPDGDLIPNSREYRYAWNPSSRAETRVSNITLGAWYETIQPALFEAREHDEIVVYPGVYTENVNFGGKNIALRSTSPLDGAVVAETMVDGGQSAPVITFSGEEDETCLLSGFTIRNGSGPSGGGVAGAGTHATIERNVIVLNIARYEGGGVYDCDGIIQLNQITGNSAVAGGALSRCDGTIASNLIAGNSSNYGGGLLDCQGTILNDTVIENRANEEGGGLYECSGSIRNCIIWSNVATRSGNQLDESDYPYFSCIQGFGQAWTNIDEDPSFVAPGRWDDSGTPDSPDDDIWTEGDYHLRPDSPCIDVGDNAALSFPGLDLDGNLRIAFGRSSVTVDMGAYEYNSTSFRVSWLSINGGLELIWNSQPDQTYTVWSCNTLSGAEWTQKALVPSQGAVTWWTDVELSDAAKFYRIEMPGSRR